MDNWSFVCLDVTNSSGIHVAAENDMKFLLSSSSLIRKRLPYKMRPSSTIFSGTEADVFYSACIEEALTNCLSGFDSNISIVREDKDHLGRDIQRYVVDDRTNGWFYIVDISSRLEVQIECTKWDRFKYFVTRNSCGSKVKFRHAIVKEVKVWISQNSYYKLDVGEEEIDCGQNSNVPTLKIGLGLSHNTPLNQRYYYERRDYEKRRDIFREHKERTSKVGGSKRSVS